jgi:hypothetical protein
MECFRHFKFYSNDNESECDSVHKPIHSRFECSFVWIAVRVFFVLPNNGYKANLRDVVILEFLALIRQWMNTKESGIVTLKRQINPHPKILFVTYCTWVFNP